MTWTVENGPDGLPIWRGRDSIVNINAEHSKQTYGCAYPLIGAMVLLAVVFIVAGSTGGRPVDSLGAALGWLMLLAFAPVVWAIWKSEKGGGLSTKQFFDDRWTLWEVKNDEFHGLSFFRNETPERGADSWAAPLAEIARVEADATRKWIGARQFGNVIYPVTEFETQAYLFMNDDSRRVICSVNANTEVTSTLARSVRTWFERAKAEAMAARPDGQPEDERRPGFDI